MRKRFANEPNQGINEYSQKRIDEEYFKGYVCNVKMKDVQEPLIVNDNGFIVCILDTDYEWLEVYPDNEKYAITIMYNDKKELIEWYFDIAKEIGIEGGIPYENDLYLDVVITPDNKFIVLDEEELQEAMNKKIVTKEEFDGAYETLNKIKNKYYNNVKELRELTVKLYKELNNELKKEKDESYGIR